jgi:hypothetical protein
MRVYVAGKMSGLPDLGFPAFHAAAAKLRAEGHEVINPAEIQPDQTAEWGACLRDCLAALVRCDAIALLPNWDDSRGARLERHVARELGLTTIYL